MLCSERRWGKMFWAINQAKYDIKFVPTLHCFILYYITTVYIKNISFPLKGRDLWVLALGRFPTQHKIGIPEFKYVANMHGDEVRLQLQLLRFSFTALFTECLGCSSGLALRGSFFLKKKRVGCGDDGLTYRKSCPAVRT